MEPKDPNARRQAVFEESDREWIARGGQLRAKRSYNYQRMSEPTDLPNLNDSTQAWSPEFDFWRDFLTQARDDALGLAPGSSKTCQHCHALAACSCCQYGEDGEIIHDNRRREGACTFSKTVQQCAWEWFWTDDARETCAMVGVEVSYFHQWLQKERKQLDATKTSSDPGLSDSTGSTDETPGMVWSLYSGEET